MESFYWHVHLYVLPSTFSFIYVCTLVERQGTTNKSTTPRTALFSRRAVLQVGFELTTLCYLGERSMYLYAYSTLASFLKTAPTFVPPSAPLDLGTRKQH